MPRPVSQLLELLNIRTREHMYDPDPNARRVAGDHVCGLLSELNDQGVFVEYRPAGMTTKASQWVVVS